MAKLRTPKPRISAAQVRAARAYLDLSQTQLADAADVHRRTLTQFEREAADPRGSTLANLQRVLEDLGIEFLFESGQAVGIRKRETKDRTDEDNL